MNEKLFKKLNEQVELVAIKNAIHISEEDERNLIFNGLSVNDILLGEDFRQYSFAQAIMTARNKEISGNSSSQPKQDVEVKKSKKEEQREAQEEYDDAFEELDDDATEKLETELELDAQDIDDAKAEYEKATELEKKDKYETLCELKKELKEHLKEVDELMEDLRKLNSKRPSGVVTKNSFTKLTAAKYRELKRRTY